MDEILLLIEAEALSPPKASRVLAYTGVAIYEATVDGVPQHRSLGGQLNGLEPLPEASSEVEYDFEVVLHSTLGHLASQFFDEEDSRLHLIKIAEDGLAARVDAGLGETTVTESMQRGIEIAERLWEWAIDDGYYERNSESFTPPEGDYAWVPTGDIEDPLEPYWNTLRPFALDASDVCAAPAPAEYSSDPDSEFYQQALEVWQISEQRNEEQEEIAQFWADDPGQTATPPGHWMAIAGQMVDEQAMNLAEAAELYAMMGVTTGDAVISCWDAKYESFLLRPVTYIQRHIDESWEPFINTPRFPEYTSGHSTFSGAAAGILTAMVGEVSFSDKTHEHRGMEPRHFDNFDHAAREAANSRLYGGIHYPMGNDGGLIQGECVAETVLETIDLSTIDSQALP